VAPGCIHSLSCQILAAGELDRLTRRRPDALDELGELEVVGLAGLYCKVLAEMSISKAAASRLSYTSSSAAESARDKKLEEYKGAFVPRASKPPRPSGIPATLSPNATTTPICQTVPWLTCRELAEVNELRENLWGESKDEFGVREIVGVCGGDGNDALNGSVLFLRVIRSGTDSRSGDLETRKLSLVWTGSRDGMKRSRGVLVLIVAMVVEDGG
jgi:hypothetical protein